MYLGGSRGWRIRGQERVLAQGTVSGPHAASPSSICHVVTSGSSTHTYRLTEKAELWEHPPQLQSPGPRWCLGQSRKPRAKARCPSSSPCSTTRSCWTWRPLTAWPLCAIAMALVYGSSLVSTRGE